jgi:selenocysteine lyase/cysteine desulfurase
MERVSASETTAAAGSIFWRLRDAYHVLTSSHVVTGHGRRARKVCGVIPHEAECVGPGRSEQRPPVVIADEFLVPEGVTYLDSASKGLPSMRVKGAITDLVDEWVRFGAPWDLWVDRLNQLRLRFGAHVGGGGGGEVFLGSSVSSALVTILTACSGERVEVIVLEGSFPTLSDAASSLARLGIRLRVASATGGSETDALCDAISNRTLAVLVEGIHHRAAQIVDVSRIGGACQQAGAFLIVDSYHEAGVRRIDAHRNHADAVLTGTMKYLLGLPGGLSLAYCSHRLLERAQPFGTGWLGMHDPFAPEGERRPADGAVRLEGGLASIISAGAALAGLELLEHIGIDIIERHTSTLSSQLVGSLSGGGLEARRQGPLVCFEHPGAADIVADLTRSGIRSSSWSSTVRLSTHIYTTRSDIDRASLAVIDTVDRMARL